MNFVNDEIDKLESQINQLQTRINKLKNNDNDELLLLRRLLIQKHYKDKRHTSMGKLKQWAIIDNQLLKENMDKILKEFDDTFNLIK